MFLLFLTLFLSYGLFNCNNENVDVEFDELSILSHLHEDIVQAAAFLSQVKQNNQHQKTYLRQDLTSLRYQSISSPRIFEFTKISPPTPTTRNYTLMVHTFTVDEDPVVDDYPVIWPTRIKPNPMLTTKFTLPTTRSISFIYTEYPGVTLPPWAPLTQAEYDTPSTDTYIPSPTGPTPKRPTFTLPDIPRPVSTWTSPTRSSKSTVSLTDPVVQSQLQSFFNIVTSPHEDIDTALFSRRASTAAKPDQHKPYRQYDEIAEDVRSVQTTTEHPTRSPGRMFFTEYEDGWHYGIPAEESTSHTETIMVDGDAVNVFTRPTTASTIVGDVFHDRLTPKPLEDGRSQRLHNIMIEMDEGYMMVFFLELTRLIAYKKAKDVSDVVNYMQHIMNGLYNKGQLAFLGTPVMTALVNLGMLLSESPIDALQSYSMLTHRMLMERKSALSTDINGMIDFADMLYKEEEGELLFDVLLDFEAYPNNYISSYEIARNLVTNFLMPFRRLKSSPRLQRLLDQVNKSLKENFPNLPQRRQLEPHQITKDYPLIKKIIISSFKTHSGEKKSMQQNKYDEPSNYPTPNRRNKYKHRTHRQTDKHKKRKRKNRINSQKYRRKDNSRTVTNARTTFTNFAPVITTTDYKYLVMKFGRKYREPGNIHTGFHHQ